MKITVSAVLDTEQQIKDLCSRIRFIGLVPRVAGYGVYVEYDGEVSIVCDRLIRLFEEYPSHNIRFN